MVESGKEAVVHECEVASHKWVAVEALDGAGGRGGAHVSQDALTGGETGQFAQVFVVPGGGDVFEEGGDGADFWDEPGYAEAVAVKWFGTFLGLVTLVDERVGWFGDELAEFEWMSKVGGKSAHSLDIRTSIGWFGTDLGQAGLGDIEGFGFL